jgi:NAD(P)-dependent dehydrogenase (short-subunit alcohol dehydrogenase family)
VSRPAGKRCLVTGGRRGIGRAVVLRSAAEGAAGIAGERARQREDGALRRGVRRVAGRADVRQVAGDDAGNAGQLDALGFRTNINLEKIPTVDSEGVLEELE